MSLTIYERECLVRNTLADNLHIIRPEQIVLAKEYTYNQSNLRVDLQTVDKHDVFREWEFKLYADYKALVLSTDDI